MEQVYRSKVDVWLVVVLVAVPVGMLDFLLDGVGISDRSATLLMVGVVTAILGFFIWLCLTTGYSIIGEFLCVKSGPFSWMIPIEDITAIEPTRNPVSAPALSLDRLVVRYGQGAELMISPKDMGGFIAEIRKHLPDNSLIYEGEKQGSANV